ncbi:MAG TPA: c-type cytochrome domain-containing protein, partial [Isosphaeraceae bacterium]|nr:c-type cytochrome domain-containing protein [Isosphaeraceae bacterium]
MAVLLVPVCLRTFASNPADDRPISPELSRKTAISPLERRFGDTVRPFVDSYCVGCHGKDKPKGDLDLTVYTSADAVTKDLGQWEV